MVVSHSRPVIDLPKYPTLHIEKAPGLSLTVAIDTDSNLFS